MKTRAHVRVNPPWICGLAMLCIGAVTTPALADTQMEPGTRMKVKYGDLNLSTRSGTAELYKRIEHAASRVCDLDSSPSDPARLYHLRKCQLAAVANAVRDVSNRNLTAMYREKHGLAPVG